jgi:glycosyltransferase involved in cell wall biosynthesis
MIESLACGTPVVAFPEGAAPEIVEHGRNGYLCHDEAAMAAAVARVGAIDRRACRRDVETRFSNRRMVREHIELFTQIVAGSSPPGRGRAT